MTATTIWKKRVPLAVLLACLGFLGALVGCQSKLIYFPRPYAPGLTARWQAETKGRVISVITGQGRQTAFLQGNLAHPRHLWIVCGGNGTVALDWSAWMRQNAPREDAFLLLDFPGYGACEGEPNPARIRESFGRLIPAACASLGWPEKPDAERLRFFGHSLGAAGVLLAASDVGIRKGVLLAPFTSTMEMSQQVIGLPVGFLVWHRFDNRKRLNEISAHGAGKIAILHGTNDGVIPVSMGRALAAAHPATVEFHEIKGCHHSDIQTLHPDLVSHAMRDVAR